MTDLSEIQQYIPNKKFDLPKVTTSIDSLQI
jgi:hypothetical protein